MSCPGDWTNFLDMRRKRFLIYLLVQAAVILAVIIIFKVILDRQIAATVAGTLFVLAPMGLMISEYCRAGLYERVWFLSVLQFWIVFALPILGIRLMNWGVPFDQLSFWGVSGPVLHEWSSKSYMIMVLVTIVRRHMKE